MADSLHKYAVTIPDRRTARAFQTLLDRFFPKATERTTGTLDVGAVSATAAELNMAADSSANTVAVTAIKTVTAAESGSTFLINNATGFAITLPAAASGLRYTFISKTSNTSGNHTIVTPGSVNIIKGFAANAAGAAVTPLSDGDTISFVANQSVAGDQVSLFSDGTSWFMSGFAQVAAGITLTKAT